MIAWAELDDQISEVRRTIQAMTFDPGAPRFFVEWYEERRTEYVLSRILTDPDMIRRFMSDHAGRLSSDQIALLERLIEHPAFWVYANLLSSEEFPLGRLHVEDFCPHVFFVYHELVDQEEIQLIPYRILLVFDNGDFFQSVGFIHVFSTLYAEDVRYFFSGLSRNTTYGSLTPEGVVQPQLTIGQMTESINEHYLEFLKMDITAFQSEISVNDEYIELVYEEYDLLHPFDRDALPGRWHEEQRDSVMVFTYLGPDLAMEQWEVPPAMELESEDGSIWDFPNYVEAMLFVDTAAGRLGVFTNTERSWKRMLYVVSNLIGLSPLQKLNPDFIVSLPILGVTAQIEAFQQPWGHWILKAPASLEEAFNDLLDIALTRSILNEAIDAEEFDIRFNLEARCKRVVLDPEIIKRLFETVRTAESQREQEGAFALSTVDGDFELHDFPKPTNKQMAQLSNDLDDSSLFTIHAQEAYPIFTAFTGDSYHTTVDESSLVESIEDLFYEFFDEIEDIPLLMMNYLFLQFLHTRDRWVPVRTFGVEVLKLLYPYLRGMGDRDTDTFITRFSKFVYAKLRTMALVEVESRPSTDQRLWGTYSIRPTRFFTTLVNKK